MCLKLIQINYEADPEPDLPSSSLRGIGPNLSKCVWCVKQLCCCSRLRHSLTRCYADKAFCSFGPQEDKLSLSALSALGNCVDE